MLNTRSHQTYPSNIHIPSNFAVHFPHPIIPLFYQIKLTNWFGFCFFFLYFFLSFFKLNILLLHATCAIFPVRVLYDIIQYHLIDFMNIQPQEEWSTHFMNNLFISFFVRILYVLSPTIYHSVCIFFVVVVILIY